MRSHREHIHGLHILCLVATFLEVYKVASERCWITANVNDTLRTCCTSCFDKGKVEPFAWWIHHNDIWLDAFFLPADEKHAQTDDQDQNETMNRVKELQDLIKKQKTKITDFDESQIKKLIQQITVFPGYFVVEFKKGVSVDITK